MSARLTLLTVDLDEIWQRVGSRDSELLKHLIEEHGEDDAAERALEELINGDREKLTDHFQHQHAYGLIEISRMLGTVIAEDVKYSEEQRRAELVLKARGVTQHASFNRFYEGPAPFGLPALQDFPVIGYLTRDEIGAALKILRPLDIMGLEKETARRIIMFVGWLEQAEKAQQDLIGNYY
jgi:hypothetical protein